MTCISIPSGEVPHLSMMYGNKSPYVGGYFPVFDVTVITSHVVPAIILNAHRLSRPPFYQPLVTVHGSAGSVRIGNDSGYYT